MKNYYGTLYETINELRNEGYTIDFNFRKECIICHKLRGPLSPNEFNIDAVFRFEAASDPEDEAIIYSISSQKYNIKGLLVNAYGIYSDELSDAIVMNLRP